jgi:hypothetical protein
MESFDQCRTEKRGRKMNRGLKLLKSPLGKLFIIMVIMVFIFWGMSYALKEKKTLKSHVNRAAAEPLETVYTGTMSKIFPEKKPDETTTKFAPSVKVNPKRFSPQKTAPGKPRRKEKPVVFHSARRQNYNNAAVKPYVPPIGLYTANPASIPPDPKSQSAPYGQLLRCELVQTVMTSNLQTPVIAMVTEPLWWNGKEAIPAGVIVHGVAASSPMRDRVGTGNKWVLVWPHRNEWNGKKLVLNAIALACDRTENAWAKIDGSAGIKGDVISNEDQKRMYAYMASFISGLGEGMVSESEDTTGSTTTKTTGGTFADALGKAFQKSASDISDQLFKELSQSMFYVEARAGTEFYLYITQDIYISEAKKNQVVMRSTRRKKR